MGKRLKLVVVIHHFPGLDLELAAGQELLYLPQLSPRL